MRAGLPRRIQEVETLGLNPPARWLWLTLILLAAFALRMHALGAKSLWYDELRQVEVARQPLADLPAALVPHSGRPLDYVITHLMLTAGQQEFWLRFPAVVWGALSVALMFTLARRWMGREAALATMALMAASPIAVQYSQEMRPYALYLFFTLLSFWSLERALGPRPGGKSPWLVFALASMGGTLTHFFYTFVLTAQVIFVAGLFVFRRVRWPQLARFGGSALAGYAALLVAANPFTLAVFAQRYLGVLAALPVSGLATETGVRVTNPDTLTMNFLLKGLLPQYGGGAGAALGVFVGLALVGLLALAIENRRQLALFGLWLILAPALVLIYLQYRQQFFAIRYLLFVLPAYLSLVVHGLWTLGRWRPLRPVIIVGGLLTLLAFDLNQAALDYGQPKDDWRRVGAFLAANARPEDAVAAPDVQFFIRFYAPGQPGTIIDANDLGPHQQALADYDRFWFVWSDYTLLPVDEVRQWVNHLPSVTLQLDPKIKIVYIHPGRTQAEMLAEAQQFVIPPPSIP
jgi:uncharacterized membrane protein